jgi:competence protein ComEA
LQLDKSHIAWLVLGLFLGIIVIALVIAFTGQTRPAPIFISPPPPSATPLATATTAPMHVYISGEVAQPNVYELPSGAILLDAVNAAGGFSEDANRDIVNLALPLSDGMHVHVPDNSVESLLPPVSGGTLPNSEPTNTTININTASLEELDRLPGVGPSIAQKIIDYRQENGPFTSIEEIQNVSGIGPAKYEQIKDLITLQ